MDRRDAIINDTLSKFRKSGGAGRRHPAEVTSDRLGDATERWADQFTAAEMDMVAVIRHRLGLIAAGSDE